MGFRRKGCRRGFRRKGCRRGFRRPGTGANGGSAHRGLCPSGALPIGGSAPDPPEYLCQEEGTGEGRSRQDGSRDWGRGGCGVLRIGGLPGAGAAGMRHRRDAEPPGLRDRRGPETRDGRGPGSGAKVGGQGQGPRSGAKVGGPARGRPERSALAGRAVFGSGRIPGCHAAGLALRDGGNGGCHRAKPDTRGRTGDAGPATQVWRRRSGDDGLATKVRRRGNETQDRRRRLRDAGQARQGRRGRTRSAGPATQGPRGRPGDAGQAAQVGRSRSGAQARAVAGGVARPGIRAGSASAAARAPGAINPRPRPASALPRLPCRGWRRRWWPWPPRPRGV